MKFFSLWCNDIGGRGAPPLLVGHLLLQHFSVKNKLRILWTLNTLHLSTTPSQRILWPLLKYVRLNAIISTRSFLSHFLKSHRCHYFGNLFGSSEMTSISRNTHVSMVTLQPFLILFCQLKKRGNSGSGLMAKWLSSCALLQQPRVSLVWILGADMALLIRPCWGGVPHTTTRGTHN